MRRAWPAQRSEEAEAESEAAWFLQSKNGTDDDDGDAEDNTPG